MDYPTRHVHLDFHTSPLIPGVGSRFDKKRWQAAMKLGRVTSINIFAKCHHGLSYYPTKVGRQHPSLRRNLLGEQIEACHEIGVRCPIYFTIGFSVDDVTRHPEWAARNADGSTRAYAYDFAAKPTDPKPTFSWIYVCPSGEYRQLILEQSHEIARTFEVDGMWYDICFDPCWCENCRRDMRDAGLDASDPRDAHLHNTRKWQGLMDQCAAIIRPAHPHATMYFNSSTSIYEPQWHSRVDQFELEDFPTTSGGYDRLALRARYFADDGKPIVAMSGKFHTAWGEFGGFKHPTALRYEAAKMIAYGANCCFGDQLHPSGEVDMETYRILGRAYEYSQRIEQLGLDGSPAADLGLWVSGQLPHDQGVANMLMESQLDFRVVREGTDLSQLSVIVLTGDARLDKATATRLDRYVEQGGALVVLGTSGLDAAGKRFMIDVGAKYLGPPRYKQDYTIAGRELAKGLVNTPYLNYVAAHRVRAAGGKVLATIREPYFDRTYGRYCSHQNTPYRTKDSPHVAAVRRGRVVYLAHALGENYFHHGARLHRDYFLNALRLVYRRPAMETLLPSAGRATFIHQPDRRRYVVHLLYAPPQLRGQTLVIDDMPPLRDVPVTIRVKQKVRRAFAAVAGKELKLTCGGGAARTVVPELACHEVVVFEY